jgi:hypothetical protein
VSTNWGKVQPYYKVIKAIRFKASEIDEWVKNNGNLKGLKGRPLERKLPFVAGETGEPCCPPVEDIKAGEEQA